MAVEVRAAYFQIDFEILPFGAELGVSQSTVNRRISAYVLHNVFLDRLVLVVTLWLGHLV